MAVMNEGIHAGEFLISEANGSQSREIVTILESGKLGAGTVLGKVVVGTSATSAALGANGGNGAMGTVTVGAGAKAGTYTLTIVEPGTDAGKFVVEDPDGIPIGHGTVAVAFSAGGLAFTLADGAQDFVAGDQIRITVAAGSGKYGAVDPDAWNGLQTACAVLWDAVDATDDDVKAVAITRMAEVNASTLDFGELDENEIAAAKADLESVGIFVREAI